MFDTALVASNRRREAARTLATLPAALAVHALALGFVMAGQLWAVTEVPDPFVPIIFVPPAAPPAAGTPEGKGEGRRKATHAAVRPQVVQPESVPSEPAHPADPSDATDDPNAVPFGDPEGRPDGVPFGDPKPELVPREEPQPEQPVILSPKMVAPVPVIRTLPEYPEIARKAHREGVVIVQAVIDRDGSVVSAEILRDIGLGCGEAATRAIREWKYTPATLDGRPVTVYLTVTVTFKLAGVE